ncbi:uncharacterized protein MELLADRAFT_102933 [Melampsora larici-populina 98AG31]|uniref:Uncharacterized protein n=1 Tax=Melampsora larici-populina (strain 98AG31 / pathotype 3-4-7) TaxID=747676 RepID=F4R8M7_MELLP|nr:uncharacterized protein MELLADRAFT_102933 [Melampsora larici-populina 98AG31]EGG11047.1 hypothetical protein MELLADRAFT_102933 [Melampsora larici-populina 98AG31]
MNSPVVKAEPSTPKEVLVSRKRPSTGTSYQPDNDGHQHVGNRPRLSSPTSNFQARLDRLQKKVEDLADSVKECAEQAEELEVARTVLEEKLVDDEEKSSKLATKQIQRELRKEIIPNITSLNEQIATLKGDLSNRLDLGRQVKEIQEQLQILEGRIAHEHAPPELSAKQMEEICQYIKQKISSLANDKTLNVKQSATPAAGKVSLDMGKACEIRGALQDMHKTFDEMIQHVLQSEEGGHGTTCVEVYGCMGVAVFVCLVVFHVVSLSIPAQCMLKSFVMHALEDLFRDNCAPKSVQGSSSSSLGDLTCGYLLFVITGKSAVWDDNFANVPLKCNMKRTRSCPHIQVVSIQQAPHRSQGVTLDSRTDIDGVLEIMQKHVNTLSDVIIMTPDGTGYHGGVQIPRNQLTMVDNKPNLLVDQMEPSMKPKFENMSMRELAEWRLGIMIQTPETAAQFNRVFDLKRHEEGYSHATYPVPFASDMSNDLDEAIISLEYDNTFIQRCLRLAEEAAVRGETVLAPTLSELHGVRLTEAIDPPTSSAADERFINDVKPRIGVSQTGCLQTISKNSNLSAHFLNRHVVNALGFVCKNRLRRK